MKDHLLESYDFELPENLIASRPVEDRHSSKLLVYDEEKNEIFHSTFMNIGQFLPAHSTLIFNRSKVFPCRLIGKKESGGRAEVFLLSLFHDNGTYEALIKARGKRKRGEFFWINDLKVELKEILNNGVFRVSFNRDHDQLLDLLQEIGNIPIPPYIRGGISDEKDKKSYQTVYAKELGSVAAPTAGLHFSKELLTQLQDQGHDLATLTLHVGAGTFSPVKSSNILDHKMHEEFFSIDEENLSKINESSYRVAVGTTTLRTLESCYHNDAVSFPSPGEYASTSIFLYPGVNVQSIDALVTNFHLPQSSLIMLVSSLIGREKTLEIYQEAIKLQYRFFSYGDGMLILRDGQKRDSVSRKM